MNPEIFFGHHINSFSLEGKVFALLLAILLGGIIGVEREMRGQSAGLRTHVLVCVGSALITLASVEIGMGASGAVRGDPARLAAQIVSGIGFLGAGAIMREGFSIHGLTTAASIWVVAGIGISIGASPHLGELAVAATGAVITTLVALNWLEDVLKLKHNLKTLNVELQKSGEGLTNFLNILSEKQIVVFGIENQESRAPLNGPVNSETQRLTLKVRLPGNFDREQLNASLTNHSGIVGFHLD